MKMVRLPRSKVKIGEPLPWNVRDEHTVLLLSKGHVIEDEHQLDLLLQRGAFVDVEEVRATERPDAPVSIRAVAAPPNLFGLWEQTTQGLQTLLANATKEPDFPARMDAFALHLLELLDYNPDIGLYRCVRQDHAMHFYYGPTHAVHTAVLCTLMARHLHWPQQRMMSLVKAALTMNMSIVALQGEMAAQDVPMKERQREKIRAHPADAVALLEQAGITDADWLQAVAQHHERDDGTGYPLGITDPCELAVALRVSDVLMAKISPRVLRPALSPQDAVRQLFKEDKGGPLSTAIIKEFGIYPPGDFVKLASGELAVVVQRTSNARAPIVAAVTDTAGHHTTHTVRHDTGQPEFAITGKASDPALLMHLPPERLYGFAKVPV